MDRLDRERKLNEILGAENDHFAASHNEVRRMLKIYRARVETAMLAWADSLCVIEVFCFTRSESLFVVYRLLALGSSASKYNDLTYEWNRMRAMFGFYNVSMPTMPDIRDIKEVERETDLKSGLILVERTILASTPCQRLFW